MSFRVSTEVQAISAAPSRKQKRKYTSELHRSPKKKRQMMLAGGFALGAAVLLLGMPELGVLGAIGTLGMGAASAITTLLAKH